MFISIVPLIPNRICRPAPEISKSANMDIPNIIYTGARKSNRCYRVAASIAGNRTSIVRSGVGTIGKGKGLVESKEIIEGS